MADPAAWWSGSSGWRAPPGVRLCPNYLLAESALELDDRTASWPTSWPSSCRSAEAAVHATLLARNGWAAAFLPNAFAPPAPPNREAPPAPRPRPARRIAEWLLRMRVLDRLERWELDRMRRLHPEGRAGADEARFDPERCKGHLVPNGRRTLAAWTARLEALGVPV